MAKSRSKVWNRIGSWSFLIGVLIAIIFGAGFLGGLSTNLLYLLVIIGVIIGLLNIADEEVSPFLMSGAVLIIASALGQNVVGTISQLSGILDALLAIFVPATIIVAIKNVFSLARN